MDYIAVPQTWLAATTKFLVLEHFDAYTIIYDHKPLAVEIKGFLMFRKVFEEGPRFYKSWIQSWVQEDFKQAVHYAEMQQVPHWFLDQHEHRHALTKIIHEATEGVAAIEIKPSKFYVTDAIFEVSAYRPKFIKIKHRDEKHVQFWTRHFVLPFGKKLFIGLQGTSARDIFH